MNYDVNCSFDNLRVFCHLAADGDSDDDEDEETGKSKITLAYQSKRTSEREGLQDMGATLTLETESKTKVVINVLEVDTTWPYVILAINVQVSSEDKRK